MQLHPVHSPADLLFDSATFTVMLEPASGWLHVVWRGEHTAATSVANCGLILQFVQQTNCTKILNDSSEVLDGWYAATQWVGADFFRQLVNAGVQAIAWINAMDWPARTCIQTAVNHAPHPLVNTFEFDDEAGARAWLQRLP